MNQRDRSGNSKPRRKPAPLFDHLEESDRVLRPRPSQPLRHDEDEGRGLRVERPSRPIVRPLTRDDYDDPRGLRPSVPPRRASDTPPPPPRRRVPPPDLDDDEGVNYRRPSSFELELRDVDRYSLPQYRRAAYDAPSLGFGQAGGLLIVVVCSLVIIWLGFESQVASFLSPWAPRPEPVIQVIGGSSSPLSVSRTPGDHALQGPPSITPDQIDRILASFGSPATGSGQVWYDLGVSYGIDPAYAVAFLIHESSVGTNQAWAGMKPDGTTTHNVGNIICAGYRTCYGRFRDYDSWETGINDWYRLIDVEYIKGRGTLTVADIIPIYAPSFENDVQGYVNVVERLVDSWREGSIP